METNQVTSLFLSTTQQCNIACSYCSADAGPHMRTRLSVDVATATVAKWLQGLVHKEAALVFTGGEPTLWGYRNLDLVCEQARSLAVRSGKSLRIGIQTNGTRIGDRFIEWCHRWDVRPSISIDGPPATSDATRGLGAKTVDGMRRLQSENIDFAVILCLSRIVYENLDMILDWLTNLGVRKIRINEIGQPPDGRTPECLTADEYFECKKKIFMHMFSRRTGGLREHNMERILGYAVHFWRTGAIRKSHCDNLRCGAGRHMASVNPDGAWTLCVERSMTGGTPRTTYAGLDAAHDAFWSGQADWSMCESCDARVICDQGCVVYHRMSHESFAEQCMANKRFWRLLSNFRIANGSI